MDQQVTIMNIISLLEKIRNDHGDAIPVCFDKLGSIVDASNVFIKKIVDDHDQIKIIITFS